MVLVVVSVVLVVASFVVLVAVPLLPLLKPPPGPPRPPPGPQRQTPGPKKYRLPFKGCKHFSDCKVLVSRLISNSLRHHLGGTWESFWTYLGAILNRYWRENLPKTYPKLGSFLTRLISNSSTLDELEMSPV